LHSFLELVTRTSGASKVHLIAHSMGARLATDVMETLSLQTAGQGPWFNQVILAAPDIDAKTFRDEIAPKVTSVAGRITVYASEKDRALQLSGFLHKDYRLGYGGSRLTVFPQIGLIDSIDASLVDFHFFELGHSHYGRELLTDIRQVLNGVPAPSRGLQPHARKPGWLIPTEAIAAARPSEPERKPSGVKASPVSQSATPDRKNKTPATTTRSSRN
jgi:esterase/lipase superfamily enzyme